MAETHDIGSKFYWHWAWYQTRKSPLFAREPTTEIDRPFRTGLSTVWKIPFSRRALVVGIWTGKSESETVAILRATGGREVDWVTYE